MKVNNRKGLGTSISDNMREELKRLSKYYGLVKCYVLRDNEPSQVECREVAKYVASGKVLRALRVCNERVGACVDVSEGEEVVVLEIAGRRIFIVSDECTRVKQNQKIAYILTGKGELRTVRSPVNGYILLYNEILGEKAERYQVFIVVKE
ncbi:MAG: DUF2118 domain-containing protein [Desulfurococcales archaeon]|nr:DUF2118 domain-containing protein [Desulfurococcales archaeon]